MAIAFMTLAWTASAAPTRAAGLERSQIAAIGRVVRGWMTEHGVPGVSVAVVRDGRVAWSAGFGLADIENRVPATDSTMYRTASMGKCITATAAMKLVEEGTLALDSPVQAYCDSFPRKRWPLTVRQLLSQQGGVRHYGGPHDAEEQSSTRHYPSVAAALAPFRDDTLRFEPGTDYLYSSYGYDVVGCAIEGATGSPFMDVIRRTVFAPSGMSRACQDDPSVVVPNRAAGYVRHDGALRNAIHVDMSNRLAAGGYLASAPEMAAFAAAFMDGRLVRPESRELMLTESRLRDGSTVNYGLGWAIEEDSTGHVTGRVLHGGSSPGASGMMMLVPGVRLAVVVMSNLEDAPDRVPLVAALVDLVGRTRRPRRGPPPPARRSGG